MDIKKIIEEISEKLLHYQNHYYVFAKPIVSDAEYDKLFNRLQDLEKKYPEFALKNSPTKRVGSDLNNKFPEIKHSISVLSLDKEYSEEGILKWIKKITNGTKKDVSFVIEEKLDGASIVLYYKSGILETALTRGDGIKGNVVTDNIRTINQIPLILPRKIDIAIRGEIFIKKSEFSKFNKKFDNKYSNPRNLAAGSLRNLKSSVVAKVPLNMFAYEGYYENSKDHIEILSNLKSLCFPVNNNIALFSNNGLFLKKMEKKLPKIFTGYIEELFDYIKKKIANRKNIDYEIDGLVIKVNEIELRSELGETSHHPKWAVAYKFDSPIAETTLESIVIQVGRNGRVSPVAILAPVQIAGSIVSRATLHNQEYIDILELGEGDRVSISKRGDVIPAVEKVIEKNKNNPSIYKIRDDCPFCGTRLIKNGAHSFCKNSECPERIKRAIVFFVSKGQMDIDTLGEKTIEFLLNKKYIKSIPDIYSFDYNKLLGEEGFKEKKIDNIKKSVLKSKDNDFAIVFTSLGFEGIGKIAVSDLIKNGFDSFKKIQNTAKAGDIKIFSDISGFGDITAQFLIDHFTNKENLELIENLANEGLKTKAEKKEKSEIEQIFKGEIWVITGSFKNFNPRSIAADEIEKRGGQVTNTVSSKTTHLLAGEGGGSKLGKAKKFKVTIVNEEEFVKRIK